MNQQDTINLVFNIIQHDINSYIVSRKLDIEQERNCSIHIVTGGH